MSISIAEPGRYQIARSNVAVAPSDLGAVKARVAEIAGGGEEWQACVNGVFEEIESLLEEALEDMR